MSALMCGRCPANAMPAKVNGLLTDPPGWSHLALTGLPIRHATLCPGCSGDVRALLTTTPQAAEGAREGELSRAFSRGYDDGFGAGYADGLRATDASSVDGRQLAQLVADGGLKVSKR